MSWNRGLRFFCNSLHLYILQRRGGSLTLGLKSGWGHWSRWYFCISSFVYNILHRLYRSGLSCVCSLICIFGKGKILFGLAGRLGDENEANDHYCRITTIRNKKVSQGHEAKAAPQKNVVPWNIHSKASQESRQQEEKFLDHLELFVLLSPRTLMWNVNHIQCVHFTLNPWHLIIKNPCVHIISVSNGQCPMNNVHNKAGRKEEGRIIRKGKTFLSMQI